MFFFDPLYLILIAPAMALALWAQWRVKSAYAHAQKVPAKLSGAEAARRLLDQNGLYDVGVEVTHGFLSDHYDPRAKALRLSPEVYQGHTAASVGIAAHEAGHAIQDAQRYAPLVIRNAAVPLASTGGSISMIVFIIGIVIAASAPLVGKWLIFAGIGLYSTVVFFQLVNLPVEFDASNRAKAHLAEFGMVDLHGQSEVKRVLDAAAMTYVAATLSAIMTLIWLLIRSGLLGGNDD